MSQSPVLLKRLFGKSLLSEVSEERLTLMMKDYPYFAHPRWLLAIKKCRDGHDPEVLFQAGTYAYHPLRLQTWIAEEKDPVIFERASYLPPAVPPATDIPPAAVAASVPEREEALPVEGPVAQAETPVTPLIQPLFAEDYFAYTGTKLPEHLQNDKRPTLEQLHSFTDWLRAMKRPKGRTDPDLEHDPSFPATGEHEEAMIRDNSDRSFRSEEEVYTEAMAEVRISAGQPDKAVAIYEKLSLYNPEKSGYFAQKIEDLKNK